MTSSGYLTTAGTAGMIDADTAGTTDFGTDGPPLRLFGTGRPDGRKEGADDPAGRITAPNGSTYTYTGTNVNNPPAFGASQWIMVNQTWQVVSAWRAQTITKDHWQVRFTRIADECKIIIDGKMNETQPPPNFTFEFTDAAERTNWGLSGTGILPVYRRTPATGDYVGQYVITGSSTATVLNWYGAAGVSYYPKYKNLKNQSPQFNLYANAQQCVGQVSTWQAGSPKNWPSAAIELSDTVYSHEELQQMEAEHLKTLEADNG